MSNYATILRQNYFYDYLNNKCHILYGTEEFIVYKYYLNGRGWRFKAESILEFVANSESGNLHSAERKLKK